jgi:tellurite methyltransferase
VSHSSDSSPARPARPSQLVLDNLDRLREASLLGPVVDLACGRGRHALALARNGIPCLGVDRNADHLTQLRLLAEREQLPLRTLRADLETDEGMPFLPSSCGAILIFRFLYRPLLRKLPPALRPGGLLLYETFAAAHRETGRGPRNPAFYLDHDELPRYFPDLEILDYAEGPDAGDPPDITARLVARKPA